MFFVDHETHISHIFDTDFSIYQYTILLLDPGVAISSHTADDLLSVLQLTPDQIEVTDISHPSACL